MSTRQRALSSFALLICTTTGCFGEEFPEIVDTWIQVSAPASYSGLDAPDPTPSSVVSFLGDGRFLLDNNVSGVYVAQAPQLVMISQPEFGLSRSMETTYVLSDEMLMLHAMRPVDAAADGFVATWEVDWYSGSSDTLTIGADGTIVWDDKGAMPWRRVGTWRTIAEDQIEVTYPTQIGPEYYFLLDGHLSRTLFTRRPY